MKNIKTLLIFATITFLLSFTFACSKETQKSQVLTKPEPFPEALKVAEETSKLNQSAKSEKEWLYVKMGWQDAIRLLESVPESNPNYEQSKNKIKQYEKYLKYARENEEQEKRKAIAIQEKLLSRIAKSYGYLPRVISWGQGNILTLPEAAWSNLSESDKDILISYARDNNAWSIVVGKVKSKDNITIDTTVMCLDKRAIDQCS